MLGNAMSCNVVQRIVVNAFKCLRVSLFVSIPGFPATGSNI
jgi:hypothetical protein